MKKLIKASRKNITSKAEELHRLADYLQQYESISEHTMLEHFFDYLPTEKSIEILKDLCRECDVDVEEVYEYM